MGLMRRAAFLICLTVGIGCGSDSTGPSAVDASGPESAQALDDANRPEAHQPDSPAPLDGPLPDRFSPDASSPDASVLDATPPEAGCGPSDARFDVHVPPGVPCGSPDDTDRDGVPDCIDGCPYDRTKIAPGVCGCNIADFDSDGDGIADCLDGCPHDPNNTAHGQCGCVGQVGLQPAGSPCTDPACPETGATCDGAGVCGHRSMCSPCPGGHYVVSNNGVHHWFCSTLPPVTGPDCNAEDSGSVPGVTRMAAQSACASKGLTLVRISTLDENRFVENLLTSRVWLGCNDLQTPGQWYWSSATSDSDTLLWSGGSDGGSPNNWFVNWASGGPGVSSCASMNPADGRWSDTDCGQALGYICQ